MDAFYEVINIVWLENEKTYGTVEKLGAFASMVKFKRNEIEVEEMIENDEFTIIDEIVFTRIIDEKIFNNSMEVINQIKDING